MPDRYEVEQVALASLDAVESKRQAYKKIWVTFHYLPEVEVEEIAPVSVTALYQGHRKESDEQWVMDAVPESSAIFTESVTGLSQDLLNELAEIVADKTKIPSDELLTALEHDSIRMPSEPVPQAFLLSRITGVVFQLEK